MTCGPNIGPSQEIPGKMTTNIATGSVLDQVGMSHRKEAANYVCEPEKGHTNVDADEQAKMDEEKTELGEISFSSSGATPKLLYSLAYWLTRTLLSSN